MVEKLNMPPLPLAGGCQCGAVRYTISEVPVGLYICHCTECQKQSSSAFGQSLRIKTESLQVTGEVAERIREMSDGRNVRGQFCGTCGTRLFHRRAAYAELMNVKAGTLDDTSWLRPAGHIWTRSKQAWVEIPAEVMSYEKQPESFDALNARWAEMVG